MLRLLITVILLALFSAACTLSTVPPFVEPPPTIDDIDVTSTPTPTPTMPPSPTPTATITRTPVVLPNCRVRTDWPIYVVAGGDTLGSIAGRINSSINELTQGNCLSNPNLITPGQQLRVPRLPPLPNPDTQAGAIQVNPFVIAEGGSYTVNANLPITVSWPQARRDLLRVEFYASPFVNNPPATLLGVDTFPGDGASIPVTFPPTFRQAVYAIGYLSSGSRQLTANRIPVFAIDTAQNVPPAFQPNLGKEGDVTVLPYGSITASWPSPLVAQSSHVEFTLIRFGTQRQFLGRDSNMADGAQITFQGGDAGPTGIHQFEAVAFWGSGIIGTSTVRVRFQVVPQVQGNITISPLLDVVGDIQVVEADRLVTLTWQNAPVGQSSQFEFALYQGGSSTSLGIDTNGADGVSITWRPPFGIEDARLIASARTPIQTGQIIQSQEARIRVGATVDPGPTQQGTLIISPIVREDSGWQVVQVGATVNITWASAPTNNVLRVEFYLTPTGTGMPLQLLETDNNLNDGAAVTWTVPGTLSAHLSAIAFTSDGREIKPVNDLMNVYSE
jgi:LysM repeat protein